MDQLRICNDKDARVWVELYAEQHGEWSPMSQKIFLPAGKKSHYHATYCFERFPGWHEMQLASKCSKLIRFGDTKGNDFL